MVYTDLDRLIPGGIMPDREVGLPAYEELASSYFRERRELGVINIGEPGEITVGRSTYPLAHLDWHRRAADWHRPVQL